MVFKKILRARTITIDNLPTITLSLEDLMVSIIKLIELQVAAG